MRSLIAAEHVEFVADRPGKSRDLFWWGRGKLTRKLKKTIRRGKSSLIVQTPYLVLDFGHRLMLKRLKRKTPDFRFVVSTNSFASPMM